MAKGQVRLPKLHLTNEERQFLYELITLVQVLDFRTTELDELFLRWYDRPTEGANTWGSAREKLKHAYN